MTAFNGTNSEKMKIISDVPKGYLLGPKLSVYLDSNLEILLPILLMTQLTLSSFKSKSFLINYTTGPGCSKDRLN